jgi:hypothetical protein
MNCCIPRLHIVPIAPFVDPLCAADNSAAVKASYSFMFHYTPWCRPHGKPFPGDIRREELFWTTPIQTIGDHGSSRPMVFHRLDKCRADQFGPLR